MANNCKKLYSVDVWTLIFLSKYFFRKRKYNNITERNALKIYMQ